MENNEESKAETTSTENAGGQSEVDKKTAELNTAAERAERATAELKATQALNRIGGESEAGQESKPKEETAKEYAEKVMGNRLK